MRFDGFGLGFCALAALGAASGCAGDDGGPQSAMPGQGSGAANGVGSGVGGTSPGMGVIGFSRPPGMPIGRGAGENGESATGGVSGLAGSGGETSQGGTSGLEIPEFELPTDETPPCSGCVELNADVNDINQRDTFVFSGGGVAVTQVVWTIIIPFNSDQLFVQPFVDNNYGTYTDLDANAFPVDTPVELVHAYSGAASTVGLAIGSAGAWTGNRTMAVFVDSVRLEDADGADAAASRTFDGGVEGLVVGSNSRNPRVVFHP